MKERRRTTLACSFSCSFLWLLSVPVAGRAADSGLQVESPDSLIKVEVQVDADGSPHYSIAFKDRVVLEPSRLGLIRDDADFSHGLAF
jgi:alpha-glucosidase